MKISTSDSKASIEFSEWVNGREIFVSADTSTGHHVSISLVEKQLIELANHLNAQIKKIKK